jgi:DinB superfamily
LSITDIINNNIETLQSGAVIFNDLNDAQYNQVQTPYFSASIGKHFRHILDHYFCFISGLKRGHISYDQRQRDQAIETERLYTLGKVQQLIDELKALANQPDSAIKVSLSSSPDTPCTNPSDSSLARELIFLQGHTTHHYAIISSQLKFMEFQVDDNFGVAASTQLYNKQQSSCAQ